MLWASVPACSGQVYRRALGKSTTLSPWARSSCGWSVGSSEGCAEPRPQTCPAPPARCRTVQTTQLRRCSGSAVLSRPPAQRAGLPQDSPHPALPGLYVPSTTAQNPCPFGPVLEQQNNTQGHNLHFFTLFISAIDRL